MQIDKNFWHQKRVFITGHTGFKGSWLSLWLQQLGAVVHGYALKEESSSAFFNVAHVVDGMLHTYHDIRDREKLLQCIQAFQPDIVFHLAAQPLVRESYLSPAETYETNVMGTVHLLESVRKTSSIRTVINVTSDKCYQNKEWCWGYREEDRLGGHDPYSNSKACAEMISQAYTQSFFQESDTQCSIATVRAGNIIGGGDWAKDRLIPDAMRAFALKQPVEIRSPHSIRPWQFILDALSGYLILAQHAYQEPSMYRGSWNFGADDEQAQPVHVIMDKLVQLWGEATWYEKSSSPALHEAQYLKLDCSKSKQYLQWHPRYNLQQSLQQTLSWYQSFFQDKDMRRHSVEQIHVYQEKILT